METYKVMQRFFHKGVMQKVGSEILLTPPEAARLSWLGYVSPVKKPRNAKKRKGLTHAKFTD